MSGTAMVNNVSGAVFVIRGGQEIAVSQGMELLVSDSIRTGMNGQCELRFADDTEVQLSPMSQVQIQDFAFNPDVPAENSFAMHMMEGLVRTVSGEVVKLNPEGFALSTPLGTAGIRGTTVITQIFPTHVVFMVTDMGAGHSVVISSVFGGDLTILMPGQGAEISLTEQQRITLIDSMPENMRDAVRDFFENQYDDVRSSHDNSILLFGDIEFLAALGAENVARGVGMLSAESEDILIELLHELGVEQPEFFLEAPPEGPDSPNFATYWGDGADNYLVPNASLFGPDFKSVNYDIRGYGGNDTIVSFNGTDTVYGGQGSADKIFKVSDEITADNLIVGGELTLSGVTLDNDTIVLRSPGLTADDEQGWTSEHYGLYGATVMSGGSVVGSAVNLSSSTGGNNVITLHGTMTGGEICGKAVNATNNCTLGNSEIKLVSGLDADGSNEIGGDLNGGIIYGDARSMSGGQAGDDYISVNNLINGAIYGDAATGSYGAGSNSIYVKHTMSGGSIHAGDGDDVVDIFTYSGGDIYMGQGGSNQSLHITNQNGDLLLKGATGNTQISIDNVLSGSLGLQTLTGSLDLTSANHSVIKVATFAGAVPTTTYQLNYASGTVLEVGAWQSGKAYVNGSPGVIRITEAQNGSLHLNSNTANITSVSGDFKVGGNTGSNPTLTVDNLTGSLGAADTSVLADFYITVETLASSGTLNTGTGADRIWITTANGGTVNTGTGDDSIYVSNGKLTLDGLADNVGIIGTGMNITLANSAGGNLSLGNLTGKNTIAADSGAKMSTGALDFELILAGGGGDLTIYGWDVNGKLDYSTSTSANIININQDTISGIDISGAGGSVGAVINIKSENMTGSITGSAGADQISLDNDTDCIFMTGATINGGGGADIISSAVSIDGGLIILGDPGSDKNEVNITGSFVGGASITGSDGVDSITISGDMTDSSISSGTGADVIKVTGGMSGTANITMGAPGDGFRNELTVSGALSEKAAIVGSNGNDKIIIDGNISAEASISTGQGSDTIEMTRGLSEGGTIHLGSGGNELTLSSMGGGLTAFKPKIEMEDPGTGLWNKVTLTDAMRLGEIIGSDGRDSITIKGVKQGGTIDLGKGDDVLVIEGAWASGSTIQLGAGADSIKLHKIGDPTSGTYVAKLDLGAGDMAADTVDLSDLAYVAVNYTLDIYNVEAGRDILLLDTLSRTGQGVYQGDVGGVAFTVRCYSDSTGTTPVDMVLP